MTDTQRRTGTVILVCGPPCSGKNHHVEQHRQPGDVVLDQDEMGSTAYRRAIAHLEHSKPRQRVWVVRCLPGRANRETFARRIQADDVVLLRPAEAELYARARQRAHPGGAAKAVRQWLEQEAQDAAPQQRARRTQQRGPGRAGRPWLKVSAQVYEEETHCWLCGQWVDQTLPSTHAYSRSADHLVQLCHDGHPLDRDNLRLSHLRCNSARSSRLRSVSAAQCACSMGQPCGVVVPQHRKGLVEIDPKMI